MKQPLHPSSSALRTLIAAVIMIIASAITAWAQDIGGGGEGEGGEIFIGFKAIVTPLTLEATVACTITVSNPRSGMRYSVDGGEKTTMPGTITIKVAANHTVQFYGCGTEITAYYAEYDDYTHIDCSADCYIYGNIMSLVDETGFANNPTLTAEYTFKDLFKDNTHLINHPDKSLVLPATTLQAYCYKNMFEGCSGLTKAPSLPAKTMKNYCYHNMFAGCTGLASAPSLPATTLADGCYMAMFDGCTRLTKAPVLPATTMKVGCYYSMFRSCTSLTTAPDLPATTLAENCYAYMFSGCSRLTTAPDLPAPKLVEDCYYGMFYDCTNLSYVKCLATNISAEDCTKDWLKDVASSGTFVKALNTTWSIGVSGTPSGWKVEEDMLTAPLTLQATADGTITITNPQYGMQYSVDDGEKKNIMTEYVEIEVSAGQTVQFYGKGTKIKAYYVATDNHTRIQCSADCYIYGNIMSLVDEKGYTNNTTLPADNTFRMLFYKNTHLINHPTYSLVLPATTLQVDCYNGMFYGCSGLTTAPDLPAKRMKEGCYGRMFFGCTSLTTAPSLPAKALATSCYASMFWDCTSLTTAPELPATTMKDDCYYGMFYGCTSLTTAPKLPATMLEMGCYCGMFYGCTSLTKAPDLPAETLEVNCYYGMFRGCTSLTTSPSLPATTLATKCYEAMFYGCTKLSYVECLATDISAEYCTDNWLKDVASSGTFVKAANTNWADGVSGIPRGWTARVTGGITLYDNGDNSATVEENDEQGVSYVVLAGRTLYRDGTWNTLCLPFDVSGEDATDGITFKGTPLAGATVKTLTAASSSNGILMLNFGDDITTITAGKPYVVKWTTTGTNIQSPVFDNVTIKNVTNNVTIDGVVTFNGTYDSKTYKAEDRSNFLLDADRSPQAGSTTTLQYATSGTRLGAFRAYFDVDLDGQSPLTDCVLDFGNNETLTCPFVERGDANGDGTISVTDIAVVVNCILQLDNTGGFSEYGADANGDGDITVTDIGVIVDKILNPTPSPPEGGGGAVSPPLRLSPHPSKGRGRGRGERGCGC